MTRCHEICPLIPGPNSKVLLTDKVSLRVKSLLEGSISLNTESNRDIGKNGLIVETNREACPGVEQLHSHITSRQNERDSIFSQNVLCLVCNKTFFGCSIKR